MSFGKVLKELRNKKKLTQSELAELLSLSKANISKYESDTIEPNIETLCMVSNIFGVSVDYLLGVTSKKENVPLVLDNAQAAFKLKAELLKLNIDIEDGTELETIIDFINSNQSMLRKLLNKDNPSQDENSILQFVAKGGEGVQTHSVSAEERKKSLEALEKLKEKK